MLINKKFLHKKNKFLSYLNKNGIETRPIISGNFLNQPSIKLYKLNSKKEFSKEHKKFKIEVFLLVYILKKLLINNCNY